MVKLFTYEPTLKDNNIIINVKKILKLYLIFLLCLFILNLNFVIKNMKNKQSILFYLILGIAVFLRIYNLGKESLWFDEAITFYRAVLDFSEIIRNSYNWDVHPPTYYLIIHFIIKLSNSEFALRFFSALCSIAAIPLLYDLIKRIIGKEEAIISILLLSVSVFHIRYSQEARVYSLFLLTSLISFIFFYKAIFYQKKHHWLVWAGISIINFYIHYFSLILLTSQVTLYIFYSLFTKNIKLSFRYQKWFFYSIIIILIGHTPQLFFFFGQASAKFSASTSYRHIIHPIHFILIFGKNLINPVDLPITFMDRYIKYFMGLFIISGMISGWKKYKKTFIFNSYIILFSLLMSWISSLFIYFGSGYRFLIFLLIPYLILLTCSVFSLVNLFSNIWITLFKIKKPSIYNGIKKITIMSIIILVTGIHIYILYYYYINQKKPDWEEGITYLSEYNSESTTIISIPEWGDYSIRYYLSKRSYNKPEVRRIKIESTSELDSLSNQFKNLIFTTDGLLPDSPFKENINTWLKNNARLLWQDSCFTGSTIWLVNKTDTASVTIKNK